MLSSRREGHGPPVAPRGLGGTEGCGRGSGRLTQRQGIEMAVLSATKCCRHPVDIQTSSPSSRCSIASTLLCRASETPGR